jgi:hypothetical protein
MKHKPESWNGEALASEGSSRGVRRSLTRAGLGQLSHAVSGALSTLQGTNARGAAQNRMRALLNQDRALLSHRACGQANLVDELEAPPEVPVAGSQTRGAAQNRMRELLHHDRAMRALREARKLEEGYDVGLDDDFAASSPAPRSAAPVPVPDAVVASVIPAADAARMSCVGATTSFPVEPVVSAVCTVGPAPAAPAPAPAPVFTPPRPVAPAAAPAPAPAAEAAAPAQDPIRTRGMAKLLALQGYKDRALSIYDELLAAEPNNAELRAEADRLRN